MSGVVNPKFPAASTMTRQTVHTAEVIPLLSPGIRASIVARATTAHKSYGQIASEFRLSRRMVELVMGQEVVKQYSKGYTDGWNAATRRRAA